MRGILENPDKEITLFINSNGGDTYASMAVVSAIKMHKMVDTVCLGFAASAATLVLAFGRDRFIVQDGHVQLHQMRFGTEDSTAEEAAEGTKRSVSLGDWTNRAMVSATKLALSQVKAGERITRWFTAKQAIACGLVDGIYTEKRWRAGCKQGK